MLRRLSVLETHHGLQVPRCYVHHSLFDSQWDIYATDSRTSCDAHYIGTCKQRTGYIWPPSQLSSWQESIDDGMPLFLSLEQRWCMYARLQWLFFTNQQKTLVCYKSFGRTLVISAKAWVSMTHMIGVNVSYSSCSTSTLFTTVNHGSILGTQCWLPMCHGLTEDGKHSLRWTVYWQIFNRSCVVSTTFLEYTYFRQLLGVYLFCPQFHWIKMLQIHPTIYYSCWLPGECKRQWFRVVS